MSTHDQIIETIQRRARPEDVADLVLEALDQSNRSLNKKDREILDRAARLSFRRMAHRYSRMLDDFRRPVGMQNSVKIAQILFSTPMALSLEDCGSPGRVLEFIQTISPQIRKMEGQSDFKHNRLNAEERKKAGIGHMSRRGYNKRFRLLARMEEKVTKLAREVQKYEFTRISKSGLATYVQASDLKDLDTACFVAYYSARRNARSKFTWTSQDRPYDEICEMLFKRLQGSGTTNWWAVAHLHPTQEVLRHLSDEQKGKLLGRWYRILQDIAGVLQTVWEASDINKQTMIVKRGNDSSTWNSTAGAWNQARTAWIEIVYALEMSELLDDICLGKVMRLMAADVAYMHRSYGSGGLEPDTMVWNDLPLPWEVLRGEVSCTRHDVQAVCDKHKVDAREKGWIAPKPKRIAEFKPTPELVHGVIITNPDLAYVLRKGRAFSGKDVHWDELDGVEIQRHVTNEKVVTVSPA